MSTTRSRCAVIAALTMFLGAGTTAQTTIRPIADFVSAQGTHPGELFWPPVRNYLGWVDEKFTTFGIMDYTGLAASYVRTASGGAIDLGTQVQGFVREDLLPDGRGLVTVLMQTRNALAFGVPIPVYPTLSFGYRADEVVGGNPPALGDCFLHTVFVTRRFGAPLPDLLQIANEPNPGEELLVLSFQGTATGALRAASGQAEGTRGTMGISQVGLLFQVGRPGFPANGFTAELVNIRRTGQ